MRDLLLPEWIVDNEIPHPKRVPRAASPMQLVFLLSAGQSDPVDVELQSVLNHLSYFWAAHGWKHSSFFRVSPSFSSWSQQRGNGPGGAKQMPGGLSWVSGQSWTCSVFDRAVTIGNNISEREMKRVFWTVRTPCSSATVAVVELRQSLPAWPAPAVGRRWTPNYISRSCWWISLLRESTNSQPGCRVGGN